MFARYSLIGALSAAAGSLAASLPDFLVSTREAPGFRAFRLMFYAYAALGVLSAALYRRLPSRTGRRAGAARPARTLARHRLQARRAVQHRRLCGRIHRSIAAGALAVRALRFVVVGGGTVFLLVKQLERIFLPVAAWLAKRVGLVNTMVFTHIPSSIFLILAAFAPNLYVALGLLLLRAALSQMDVPTRTSYVMAVVTPAERPAAASVTAVPRSLASAISPAISGALLMTAFSGLPLVVCGTLKIAYDLALLYLVPPHQAARGEGLGLPAELLV